MLAVESSEAELDIFLKYNASRLHWPVLTVEEWKEIVNEERRKNEVLETIVDGKGASVIRASNEQNELTVPLDENSAWQTYKRRLLKNGFGQTSVHIIEDTTLKILNCLSRDTREIGAIKGLVVGNVQSGKTANIGALMAMAADYGWNMFIILSGMMVNLQKQTQRRLISDLQGSTWDWEAISDPKQVEELGKRLIDKQLSTGSTKRYLSVCIKNKKRLENLIGWFHRIQAAKENVRMLVIDDECDQASVNTSPKERTTINKLILKLINDKNAKNKKADVPFQAENYIGYTATPYANVLNEPPGENSLYPKDFISALSVSDNYFGPQQIFCYDTHEVTDSRLFPGLDIIRTISDAAASEIDDIQNGNAGSIPLSLFKKLYAGLFVVWEI